MFETVNLEVSLKPFKKTDSEYIRAVCTQIFEQWRPLLKGRRSISIMLWASDGSEILDYAGNLDDEFEWARYVGTANQPYLEDGEPLETSLHSKKQDYMKDAPVMTYRILKEIIDTLKEEGKRAFPDSEIRVGETFDIGPEFAISDFKYNRHLEIASGHTIEKFGFVDATARLKGDTRKYAAYPDGIPDGTPFGTFLGKQTGAFFRDVGFDYLWLSNGLGFSSNPWTKTGKIFDGEKYYPEKLAATKERVFEFWKLFREACPDVPLETRGTNNSVGIDYASDGVPLYDIYTAGLDITAPPNSPWAALNDNFGLEIMGHMTRVCELPSEKFPFRYYIHDPWWINSPWYDRYDGAPSDIYLPMAISRIDKDGVTRSANSFNILSIDNSYGGMPDACVNEPLPHILKAEKDAPDEPAPIVWIYPMREYTTSEDAGLLREMNLGDNFISEAINQGFPLCSVASTDNFLLHTWDVYKKSILLSPVPENPAVYEKLMEMLGRGIPVIIYGTKERLEGLGKPNGVITVDIEEENADLLVPLASLGYKTSFTKRVAGVKPPTMALHRYNNAHMLSVYCYNTTTDTHLHFPLGAPILCGTEAVMENGNATYRFSRAEHRECRVFVEQKSGVISCKECHPANVRYRRRIELLGLEDATVRLFPEHTCEAAVAINRFGTPRYDERFRYVDDEIYGKHLLGEHVSGDVWFWIGHKGTDPEV